MTKANRRLPRWGTAACVATLVLACPAPPKKASSATSSEVSGPRVRVLGIAQDGGLPHAGCDCRRCRAAKADPARASGVSSLGIIVPGSPTRTFLVDATPDFPEQLVLLEDVRDAPQEGADRTPIDGVLLTHAHIGHYLGLSFLGFEALSTKSIPVWATPRLAAYLESNGPWAQLVEQDNIELRPTTPGSGFDLVEHLEVTPFLVPHRDEYSDTVGYLIAGERKTVVFIPDTSPWAQWDPTTHGNPLDIIDRADVALLDATFHSGAELPGRDLSKIGHPLMTDTMDMLQSRVDSGELEVIFIHLNHSNPALEPESSARSEIERRGFSIASAGLEIAL